jgi:hypothetical protein
VDALRFEGGELTHHMALQGAILIGLILPHPRRSHLTR